MKSTSYLALLRGINVGGRNIKMADLKQQFIDLGFSDTKTILQTGNIVFNSNNNEREIKELLEEHLSKNFVYEAKVQVISIDNLKAIVNKYPYKVKNPKAHDYIVFFENELEKNILKEEYILKDLEQVSPGGEVVYWRVCKGETLKTSFAKLLVKSKYKNFNTVRNLNTLRKIIQ